MINRKASEIALKLAFSYQEDFEHQNNTLVKRVMTLDNNIDESNCCIGKTLAENNNLHTASIELPCDCNCSGTLFL